ncbi:hypothetical protein HYG81_03930 [Natrinema zhouii]|uniref:Sulfatase-like hydrolase/transferase n=1 Tax=Natrinema zhouii TaxID=1710539 RepID=A0A7D6CQU9_9EURY|nr:hypothetical protein [Natrinema zhouii]QLK26774.1 hypothetical protein HYG81_03930 [Natrinema zhouii]
MRPLAMMQRALDSPEHAARYLNRLYHTLVHGDEHYRNGVAVLGEDWDNLILLDGCRYDTFARHVDWDGALDSRYSRGSSTVEFLRANVANETLNDTVYVTANPQFHRHRDELEAEFHARIDVWKDDGWDEEYKTVLPETVAEYALSAAEEYPQKRLLVHFIQPHYPFIGSKTSFDKRQLHSDDERPAFWNEVFTGQLDLTAEDIRPLYDENLRLTLPSVEELLAELRGKTVVTADHGNAIGERSFPIPIREWGHPQGVYMEETVKVPWFVWENGDRKEYCADSTPDSRDRGDSAVVEERLQELGYRT